MIGIIEKLQGYVAGCDYDSFSENDMMVETCIFNLGQLGETANRLKPILTVIFFYHISRVLSI